MTVAYLVHGDVKYDATFESNRTCHLA